MDFNRALSDINLLRNQMARSTKFRGYGPATIAATGLLGLGMGAWQGTLIPHPDQQFDRYLLLWVTTAAVAVIATSLETIRRTWRVHPLLAREMIHNAAMHFVPPLAAAMLLTLVMLHSVPQCLWLLPGLWQLMFSLGVFSSCRLLPRAMAAVGLWYLCCGLLNLATGTPQLALSGLAMGIPFGVGQLLVAAILYRGYQENDEEKEFEA